MRTHTVRGVREMSEELIKKSDAIKAIASLHILADEEKIFKVYADNPHSMTTDFEGTLIDAINAIKSIPTIEPIKWMPCSERLPSEERLFGTYLISVGKYTVVTIAEYKRGKWLLLGRNDDVTDDVIAWMPLPEPYDGADMRGADDG